MIRIIAGKHHGRKLFTPQGRTVRPTNIRARTALFNILTGKLEGKNVLELFAGAGSIGFECLSRGAKHVTFIEKSASAIRCLKATAENFGEEDNATIIRYDIRKRLYFLSKENKKFDFIFADPPYNYFSANFILDLIAEANLTDENSIVVIEHDAKNKIDYDNLPVHWECYRNSKYGKAVFSFFANKKN